MCVPFPTNSSSSSSSSSSLSTSFRPPPLLAPHGVSLSDAELREACMHALVAKHCGAPTLLVSHYVLADGAAAGTAACTAACTATQRRAPSCVSPEHYADVCELLQTMMNVNLRERVENRVVSLSASTIFTCTLVIFYFPSSTAALPSDVEVREFSLLKCDFCHGSLVAC